MKRVGVMLLVMGFGLAGMAQTDRVPSLNADRFPVRSRLTSDLHTSSASPNQALRLPSMALANAVGPCPPEAQGAAANAGVVVTCSFVPVPFDREHPNRGTISIYYELYLHTGPGSAESAILVQWGVEGKAQTSVRDYLLGLFGPNLDVHDLLLIDNRGSGRSGAIDCPQLQYGTAPWVIGLIDCAVQLGDDASRYGSGDIAQDQEAVRATLGYDKVDFFGASEGGVGAIAYATRFGARVRSILLDSPYGGPVLYRFDLDDRDRTHSEPRMLRLDCRRSPTCSPDHPNPDTELEELIRRVREHPVEGYGHETFGKLLYVRIDERLLLGYIIDYPTGNFTDTGELLAAGRSLAQGDDVPLLRLGAEGFGPLASDFGDPTIFSAATDYDARCLNLFPPWNWHVPMLERGVQYADAVSDLPVDFFAPFSKYAATGLEFSLTANCLYWQKPSPSSPVVPSHAIFPNVPTLVLSDDMDNLVPLEEATSVAALFPDSTLVEFVEAGHPAVSWTQCAYNLASSFIETLQVGDTSCAKMPQTIWPAVGRFPLIAADARAAKIDPQGDNQIGEAERKVVTVAVAAATDAQQRSFLINEFHPGLSDGVGLRAGTFHTDYAGSWKTTLTNCAFARDVTVSGTVTWNTADNSLVADLTVSGSGTRGGTLHVEGAWEAPGPVGEFKVFGMLGGRRVAVLIPEA